MPNWKLTVEYDGTRYYGWQEQKHARTVAGELRLAAERFLSKPVEMMGAGRTDAGVHAIAQVASLKSERRAKPLELLRALNDRLPSDINVLRVEEAHPRFDPRRDALARFYLYQIATRRSAFAKRYVWWVKDRLDVDSMRQAAEALAGRHDFSSFCEATDEERSTIVVVEQVEVAIDGELLLFRIGASHFLWKMVRRIVGTLVEVGRGSIGVQDFKRLVESRSQGARAEEFQVAAHTAPPSGLFLERVTYNKSEKILPLAAAFGVKKA
jgi:tRNA pseudouridine38-40 synthase